MKTPHGVLAQERFRATLQARSRRPEGGNSLDAHQSHLAISIGHQCVCARVRYGLNPLAIALRISERRSRLRLRKLSFSLLEHVASGGSGFAGVFDFE